MGNSGKLVIFILKIFYLKSNKVKTGRIIVFLRFPIEAIPRICKYDTLKKVSEAFILKNLRKVLNDMLLV